MKIFLSALYAVIFLVLLFIEEELIMAPLKTAAIAAQIETALWIAKFAITSKRI